MTFKKTTLWMLLALSTGLNAIHAMDKDITPGATSQTHSISFGTKTTMTPSENSSLKRKLDDTFLLNLPQAKRFHRNDNAEGGEYEPEDFIQNSWGQEIFSSPLSAENLQNLYERAKAHEPARQEMIVRLLNQGNIVFTRFQGISEMINTSDMSGLAIEERHLLLLLMMKPMGTILSQPQREELFKVNFALAQEGNAYTKYILALHYEGGIGIPKDNKECFNYIKTAAEMGHAPAQYSLSIRYGTGKGTDKDENEAFRWAKIAAENGDIQAQSILAFYFFHGIGTETNLDLAFKLSKIFAENGDMNAQSLLATCYLNGKGTEINLDEAHKWFKSAADSGFHSALLGLAIISEKKQEFSKALRLYTLACQKGVRGAAKAQEILTKKMEAQKNEPEKIETQTIQNQTPSKPIPSKPGVLPLDLSASSPAPTLSPQQPQVHPVSLPTQNKVLTQTIPPVMAPTQRQQMSLPPQLQGHNPFLVPAQNLPPSQMELQRNAPQVHTQAMPPVMGPIQGQQMPYHQTLQAENIELRNHIMFLQQQVNTLHQKCDSLFQEIMNLKQIETTSFNGRS